MIYSYTRILQKGNTVPTLSSFNNIFRQNIIWVGVYHTLHTKLISVNEVAV